MVASVSLVTYWRDYAGRVVPADASEVLCPCLECGELRSVVCAPLPAGQVLCPTNPICGDCFEKREREEHADRVRAAGMPRQLLLEAERFPLLPRVASLVSGVVEAGGWVFLYGDPGTGKSLGLCQLALKVMARTRGAARYTTETRLIESLRSEDAGDFRDVSLLVLDDLGQASTDFRLALVSDLVDWRYGQGLQTLCAANAAPQALHDGNYARILSRCLGRGERAALVGADRRTGGQR